jgi:hypothetical protein
VIDANAFRRFVKDVTPSAKPEIPWANPIARLQYVQRCALVWIIQQAMADGQLTNVHKLRVARDLSNPEVESQPQRWAERFEVMAGEVKHDAMTVVYALAADACALVTGEPEGDSATATDGNGDVRLDEVA